MVKLNYCGKENIREMCGNTILGKLQEQEEMRYESQCTCKDKDAPAATETMKPVAYWDIGVEDYVDLGSDIDCADIMRILGPGKHPLYTTAQLAAAREAGREAGIKEGLEMAAHLCDRMTLYTGSKP